MKHSILQVVREYNGIKGVKLELGVIDSRWPLDSNPNEYHAAITELVNSKELIKFDYINPNESRIRSIFFIIGTIFLFDFKGGDVATNPSKTIVDGESKGNT